MTETGKKIMRAGLVVMFFHLLWKFSGLIANVVLSYYGRGPVTDAYFTAHDTIIFSIFLIGEDIFGPAFLPIFMQTMKEKGEKAAWGFASTILILLGVVLTGMVVWLITQPDLFIGWVAPKFTPETKGLAVSMLQLMAFAIIPLTMASVTYVLLNAYKKFGISAAADGVNRIVFAFVIGLGFLIFSSAGSGESKKLVVDAGMAGFLFGLGILIGALGKLGLHLRGLGWEKLSLIQFRVKLNSPEMKRFLWLALPLVDYLYDRHF